MRFDHDIIREFIPKEDQDRFLVWDNIFLSKSGNIIAIYRSPFEETIHIPIDEYNSRLIQKNRDNKLNSIL